MGFSEQSEWQLSISEFHGTIILPRRTPENNTNVQNIGVPSCLTFSNIATAPCIGAKKAAA
jgi:hypothetical protein